MRIYLLAFVGGVLTILSPCILPVLPFVFARADRRFADPVCRCWAAWR
jgi:cytochrome c biogenesis protein CcdA